MSVTYFTLEFPPDPSVCQILPQASSSNDTRLYCPVHHCTGSAKRPQDLDRHMLESHLPCHLYCPSCFWRGDRTEDLTKHLQVAKCGQRPRKQCQIYEKKLILDWILNDGEPIEKVVCYALSFVSEKARELGKVEEWRDAWGRQGKIARRRYDHLRR
ncbi:hypothetical protein BGW80DRAFT_150028 [Lactifluus volemus]|nr:hypothetical protein BGW80DRAFT_150028 [Lactifluus volemus]